MTTGTTKAALLAWLERLLARDVGVVEASREIWRLAGRHSVLMPQAAIFKAIDSKSDHLPVGRQRDSYDSDALRAKDVELVEIDRQFRNQAELAAAALLRTLREEHSAEIHWSSAQAAHGLPDIQGIVDPAWPQGADPRADEGWSLVCDFDVSPREQDNPSKARVRFAVDTAPHAALRPGAVLQVFERETQDYAQVRITD